MTKVKELEFGRKIINLKLSSLLCLSMLSGHAMGDVYDVLRGTAPSQNLTFNDVQSASTDQNPALSLENAQTQNKPTSMREEAFKELLNKTFPLKPEQIQQLHKEWDKSVLATNASPTAPPQPMASTLTVDLSPGATPPVIRLATGFVTSMVFLDSTGQPWPLLDYDIGNPNGFNIKWDSKTNTLFVQPMKDHISGNMAVRLVTMPTPVMISLVTGQRNVDYRIDIQVPGQGPNATAPVMDNPYPTAGASQTLMSALDGIPPAGSIELNVAKEYGRAWVYAGRLIFRTKLTLLSPAWSASVSGPDGTKVYELMQTPLLLASKNGKTVKIELTGL